MAEVVPKNHVLDGDEDEDEDCSICFEPFSIDDPACVTCCNHEYHFQCILEWSQRSRECPICWQLLELKEPLSQELLEAVEVERNSRSRLSSSNVSSHSRIPPEDFVFEHVVASAENIDFDEHFMQQLAAVALGNSNHFHRRQRHRSSGMSPSQFLNFASSLNDSDVQETSAIGSVMSQSSVSLSSPERNFPATGSEESHSFVNSTSSAGNSPAAVVSSERCHLPPSFVLLAGVSNVSDERHSMSKSGFPASPATPHSPRRSRPSELLSFSESLKSKFSAVSSRCKESISKGTRGLKEKLLARNNSVRESCKEVKHEVTVTGVGSSSISHKGKKIAHADLIIRSPSRFNRHTAYGTSSNSQAQLSGTSLFPGGTEVSQA